MTKVIFSGDCGNSPKKLLLRDFNAAVAKGSLSVIKQYITDKVIWHLFEPAGQKQIFGRDNVLREYKDNLIIKPVEFVINTVITHGNAGAVNGAIKAEDGKSYVFCDIYMFNSLAKGAKIKEMTSYIIEVKK
jgi:hypothetical protein